MTTSNIPRNRFNTNNWNRKRYSLWAPVYDWVTGGFGAIRRRSLELLALKANEKVLLLGAGTGLDLDFIRDEVAITAIDLTPAMINKLRVRAEQRHLPVDARVMDGQALEFPDASFDAVVLHLIVAVIPDPVRCLKETARVLKPGGRAVIFDKFLPERGFFRFLMRLANPFMGFLASEITRSLPPILADSGLTVLREEPASLRGVFKIILLKKDQQDLTTEPTA